MEKVCIYLNKKQLRKLLKKQTIQVKHGQVSVDVHPEDDLHAKDDDMKVVHLHLEDANRKHAHKSVRAGAGFRLQLTPAEVEHNAKMSKHFKSILTKAQKKLYGSGDETVVAAKPKAPKKEAAKEPLQLSVVVQPADIPTLIAGDATAGLVMLSDGKDPVKVIVTIPPENMADLSAGLSVSCHIKKVDDGDLQGAGIGRDIRRGFQKFGSDIKAAAVTSGKFLNKHRKVLATVANKVALPLVAAAVKSETGIDLAPAIKPAQGMIQDAIDRKLSKKGGSFLPSGY